MIEALGGGGFHGMNEGGGRGGLGICIAWHCLVLSAFRRSFMVR